jgi:hypothetical protein
MSIEGWRIKFSAVVRTWCEHEVKNVAFLPVGESKKSCSDLLKNFVSVESLSNLLNIPLSSLKRFVGLWIDLGLLSESNQLIQLNIITKGQNFECQSPDEFIEKNPPVDSDSKLAVEYWKNVTSHFMRRETLLSSLLENQSQWSFMLENRVSEVFELYANDSYFPRLFGKMFALANEETDLESLKLIYIKNPASLMDIAGGSGSFLKRARKILPPDVSLSLLESPHAVEIFRDEMLILKSLDIGICPFDFDHDKWLFSEKSKFDAVHLGWILHDWDEQKCDSILLLAREMLSPGGYLYISEALLNEDEMTGPASFSNVLMLCMANGYERSLSQYRKILERSDFNITNVIMREKGRSLIEAQRN